MANSLFHKDTPEKPSKPSPYELIEKEVAHLRKGTSVRHGPQAKATKSVPWFVVLGLIVVLGLFALDPPIHAWYKGEAVRTYLYLHNYTSGALADRLVATHILAPDEIDTLNHRTGSFQSYYPSPEAAQKQAQVIIDYIDGVQNLHRGDYVKLDPIGRMRYLFFVKMGLGPFMPTQWDFLDPTVGE